MVLTKKIRVTFIVWKALLGEALTLANIQKRVVLLMN